LAHARWEVAIFLRFEAENECPSFEIATAVKTGRLESIPSFHQIPEEWVY